MRELTAAELLDKQHIEAVNQGGVVSRPLPVQDTILFKLQGNEAQVKEAGRMVTEIVKRHGGGDLLLTKDDKEGDDIWAARRGAVFAAMAHSGYESAWRAVCVLTVSTCGVWQRHMCSCLKAA